MKDQERLTKALKTLFRTHPLAVLATQNELQPYTSLVAFAASDDLKELLFATTRATRKYANFSSNPRVAMLVDNRSNRLSDFSEAMAVTALGAIEEVQFLTPFKFYRNQSRTLTIQAEYSIDKEDIVADCRILGSRILHGQSEPEVTLHFSGRVRLVSGLSDAVKKKSTPHIGNGARLPILTCIACISMDRRIR